MEIVEIISKHYDNAKNQNERLVLRGMLVGQHLAKSQDENSSLINKYMHMVVNRIIEDETKDT